MGDDAPPAPPGWYQDPDELGVLRYWDGESWSDSPPSVPPPGVGVQTPIAAASHRAAWIDRAAEQPGVFWGAAIACVAMGVGAVGTWATALGFISIAGTTGGDGTVVLGAAIVALLALWAFALRGRTWSAAIAVLAGIVGAAVTGIDLHKLSGIGTTNFFGGQVRLVHAGWGIDIALGASVALVVLVVATVGSRSPRAQGQRSDTPTVGATISIGVGTLALLLAVGAVIAVANVGTHNHVQGVEQANASTSASTQPNETPAVATGEQTSSATTETSTTPSATPPALEALEHYWSDIGAHDYAAAYAYLALDTAGMSKNQFIESEQHAGIQRVSFTGQMPEGATSGTEATIEVSSLKTKDHEFGCRNWSGSYEMTEQSGSWLIQKASLTPHPCG